MKKIFYSIIAAFGLFATTSCEDMLMTENDSMVIDPELGDKTDSVFYALGIAQAMQQVADQYFFIGEMRGDLVTTTTYTDNHLRELADYSATSTNRYDSAYVYYKVINNCNYYLAHRDTSLFIGSTNVAIDEYAAVEAWRAWAYLQLARTYGGNEVGIPFYTEPLTAISQIREENFPKLTLSEIVAELAPSLERFAGLLPPNFGQTNYNIGTTNWGQNKAVNFHRIFVPVDVVLGEMYLEDGQWLKAAQAYARYLCDNKLVAQDLRAGIRNQSSLIYGDYFPTDFSMQYNSVGGTYNNIFNNAASPIDVLTYIPMAVSSQRGEITDIPLAFGYDYYSTDASNNCPRVPEVQIAPSPAYYALTDSCDFYYYPESYNGTVLSSNPDTVLVSKLGDGRANYSNPRNGINGGIGGGPGGPGGGLNIGNSAILNRDATDTTKVYIAKAMNANVYLFRTTTVYLHLAEALNRLGYPEIAFAILRNGISTYLEELVPGYGDVTAPYQYMTPEAISLLTNEVPFFNAINRPVFAPDKVFGIHSHGGGTSNSTLIESNMTVNGSLATAVGSQKNMSYLPDTIIGAKILELAETFNIPNPYGTSEADTLAAYVNAMEDLLCDEYAKEFAFEGIRFYDLQRMARHKNDAGLYGGDFGSRWFADKLKGNNPAKSLLDPKNWYLPFK